MIKTQTNNSGIYPLRPCSQWRLQWERQTGPVSLPRLCPGRQSFISFSYEAQVFRVSQYHSVHQVTNKGQFLALMAPEGRISKANFKKFSPLRATPFRTYRQYKLLLCAGLKAPQCWDPDHHAHPHGALNCAPVSSPGAATAWSNIAMAPSLLLPLPFLNSSLSPLSSLFRPFPFF